MSQRAMLKLESRQPARRTSPASFWVSESRFLAKVLRGGQRTSLAVKEERTMSRAKTPRSPRFDQVFVSVFFACFASWRENRFGCGRRPRWGPVVNIRAKQTQFCDCGLRMQKGPPPELAGPAVHKQSQLGPPPTSGPGPGRSQACETKPVFRLRIGDGPAAGHLLPPATSALRRPIVQNKANSRRGRGGRGRGDVGRGTNAQNKPNCPKRGTETVSGSRPGGGIPNITLFYHSTIPA
jgi:hypothetical protein